MLTRLARALGLCGHEWGEWVAWGSVPRASRYGGSGREDACPLSGMDEAARARVTIAWWERRCTRCGREQKRLMSFDRQMDYSPEWEAEVRDMEGI